MSNITSQHIRQVISEAIANPEIIVNIGDDDNLFSQETALDSVDLVSIIVLVERTFDVDYSKEPDITKIFTSINTIKESLLQRKHIVYAN